MATTAAARRSFDDDMLIFARALRDKGVAVPEIARKLMIKSGKTPASTRRSPHCIGPWPRPTPAAMSTSRPSRDQGGQGGP
jgi:hypothetical protein